jgi:hypothetical protein
LGDGDKDEMTGAQLGPNDTERVTEFQIKLTSEELNMLYIL